jgi:hypothetical protein
MHRIVVVSKLHVAIGIGVYSSDVRHTGRLNGIKTVAKPRSGDLLLQSKCHHRVSGRKTDPRCHDLLAGLTTVLFDSEPLYPTIYLVKERHF